MKVLFETLPCPQTRLPMFVIVVGRRLIFQPNLRKARTSDGELPAPEDIVQTQVWCVRNTGQLASKPTMTRVLLHIQALREASGRRAVGKRRPLRRVHALREAQPPGQAS